MGKGSNAGGNNGREGSDVGSNNDGSRAGS